MSTVPTSPSSFVLALGGANLDIVATAPGFQAAESNPGRIRCAPGGVARNVAENLARLGHAVGLVTLLFIIQNQEPVDFEFLWFSFNTGLWLMLLVSVLAGVAIGLLLARRRARRKKRETRDDE